MTIKLLKNKHILLLLIYTTVLIFFTIFSYKIMFHDAWEYLALTKKFAGYLNKDVFIVHSLAYPFFLSFFVKFFPSVLTMKLVNIGWIFLIGFLLYKSGSKKTSFLIWVFSPITWVMSIQISPVLPASFFLLVAYLSIKKWQDTHKNLYFIISALSLGLSAVFYDLAIIYILFFILSFFYDRKLKEVIFYSLFTFLSFSLRLILDASLFSLTIKDKLIIFPFYSLLRFWGAMLIIKLGLHPAIPISQLSFSNFNYLYFLFIISPLLFYIFKINYKKNKNIIIFLILSILLLLFQGKKYIYYLVLAPIFSILLGKIFERKQLLLHIIISSFIILLMTYPYFIEDEQTVKKRNLETKDLKMITEDFSFDAAVFSTNTLVEFYIWDKNLPYFISRENYNRILQNNQYFTYYIFEIKSKLDISGVLESKIGLKMNIKEGIDYQNLPLLLEKEEIPPRDYKLIKCYNLLCVYQKISD